MHTALAISPSHLPSIICRNVKSVDHKSCLAGLGQATADVELVCMRFTNKKKKKKKIKFSIH
jgi:hypothetical protein